MPEAETVSPSVDIFKDGVLEIRLPMTEEAKKTKGKKITIK